MYYKYYNYIEDKKRTIQLSYSISWSYFQFFNKNQLFCVNFKIYNRLMMLRNVKN